MDSANGVKKNKFNFVILEPYLLMLPSMVVVVVLILWPITRTFAYSFMSYSPIKPDKIGFIGLDNFKTLLSDSKFMRSLSVSSLYASLTVLFQFILGFTLALLMKNMKLFKGFYRAAVFAPWAVSGVLTAIMWKMIFDGSFGVINDLLLRFHIIEKAIPFGTTRMTAFIMVIIASVWRGIPYFTISLLAALTSIPDEIYESGRVDGAGPARLFFSITLPYLREVIVLTTLLRTIWTFNDVDIVYSLTSGGPANATLTLPVYVTRNAVEYMDYGYGSTLAIGVFMVLLVFAVIYMQFGKSNDDFST